MKVVVAPDSFKGTVTAAEAATAIADGWRRVRPGDDLVLRPMADGGEGTLDAFATAVPGARRVPVRVTGPDGRPTDATWLLLPLTPDAPHGTAVVELASTSGIELLSGRLRPWDASTRGFGEAIAAALDHGVDRLVLGIGSSASTDGGVGMLSALGARFLDAFDHPVPGGAAGLADIARVDTTALRRLPPGGATVLTDVSAPLLGPDGAAAVFGPQKGIDDVPRAEAGLSQLASLVPVDPAIPGAGAAGGTGFALLWWGARLMPGAREVSRLVGLDDAMVDASIVVTGEGSFDAQSASGKVPFLVAQSAASSGVPVALIAGRIASDADASAFTATLSLSELAGSTDAALAEPIRWLTHAGALLARRLEA